MNVQLSIVLASSHRAMLAQLRHRLAHLPVEVLAAADALDGPLSIAEHGTSLVDKAQRKAERVASDTMLISIGDASGLEVDALGGLPGARSSRFANEGATDAENNAELLRRLHEVDDAERTARFHCVLALADPWSDGCALFHGTCEGHIAHKPSESGGFGYSSLFIVKPGGVALSELQADERQRVSHQRAALNALYSALERLLRARLGQRPTAPPPPVPAAV